MYAVRAIQGLMPKQLGLHEFANALDRERRACLVHLVQQRALLESFHQPSIVNKRRAPVDCKLRLESGGASACRLSSQWRCGLNSRTHLPPGLGRQALGLEPHVALLEHSPEQVVIF